jgi:hypothetical protein
MPLRRWLGSARLRPIRDVEVRFPAVWTAGTAVIRSLGRILSASRRRLRAVFGIGVLSFLCASLLLAATEESVSWGEIAFGFFFLAMWASMDAPAPQTLRQRRCDVAGRVVLVPGVLCAFLASRDWAGPFLASRGWPVPVIAMAGALLLALGVPLLLLGRGPCDARATRGATPAA